MYKKNLFHFRSERQNTGYSCLLSFNIQSGSLFYLIVTLLENDNEYHAGSILKNFRKFGTEFAFELWKQCCAVVCMSCVLYRAMYM